MLRGCRPPCRVTCSRLAVTGSELWVVRSALQLLISRSIASGLGDPTQQVLSQGDQRTIGAPSSERWSSLVLAIELVHMWTDIDEFAGYLDRILRAPEAELTRLKSRADAMLASDVKLDSYSRAHLAETSARITKVLDAKMLMSP